jgi:xylulokinase
MSRRLVAGVDSSTQSTKVVVRDAETGEHVREGRAPHPPGTEVDPREWWSAFALASAGDLLEGVDAISVGGQQHGLVLLDDDGEVVRPALLWNDNRSAGAAADLVSELGGGQAWADAVGSVPVASFTVTKLRWVAEHDAAAAARARTALLPHDYLTWLLSGRTSLSTDRSEASGTGYWSPASGSYRDDLMTLAFGRTLQVPEVARPDQPAGRTPDGVRLGPGAGDNAAAALGVGALPGDVVLSIGTSGTVSAVSEQPTQDGTGTVAGFADATGRYLPLVATLNAARVLTTTAALLGTDFGGLDALALAAPPGAEGVVLLPYFEGERTPNRPDATAVVAGLRLATSTRENLARAAVEGLVCGLVDGLEAMVALGVPAERVLLVGGGARSAAVQHVAATLFGRPVLVPPPGEYVADGAARQAAWVLSGETEPPQWAAIGESSEVLAEPAPVVREAYAAVRDAYAG